MLTNNEISSVAARYAKTDKDKLGFEILYEFLISNPDTFNWRGNKPNLETIDGLDSLAEKYFDSKYKILIPSTPKTVPDEMVSVILENFYNHPTSQHKQIQIEHQHSMAAENIVGELLERYIDGVLSTEDWVWCCGALIKHVDFIKKESDGYKLLQIKNRDNSENSSSKAIRNGTAIVHWFRTYSKTGLTNWQSFPDAQLKEKLSEEGFIKFVEEYAKSFTSI